MNLNSIRSAAAYVISEQIKLIIENLGSKDLSKSIDRLNILLSKCHDLFHDDPEQNNFLSFVTMLESSIGQNKWKRYNKAEFEVLKETIQIAIKETTVTFQDYELARKKIAKSNVNPLPEISFESIQMCAICGEPSIGPICIGCESDDNYCNNWGI